MQRVRIGLTGLAGVFLLVLAAAAFFGLARREPDVRSHAATPTSAATGNFANEEAPKEPLAELGVTPGNLPDAPVIKAPAAQVPPPLVSPSPPANVRR